MKRFALVLTALATLPLVACGAAPDGTQGTDGVTSDGVGTTDPALRLLRQNPPTVIDFDTDPAGNAVANDTVVDATYASKGVTFSCIVCTSGHGVARTPGRSGNGVSLWRVADSGLPFFDARWGAVRADFTTPRSSVSIDALEVQPPEWLGTPLGKPWLEAYDTNNALVGQVYYPAYGTTGFGQWQTLTIDTGVANIAYVRFSSKYVSGSPPVYGEFDNLTFNTDPTPLDIVPVKLSPIDRPVILKPVP
jgi:hypothetical protein